MPEHLIAYGLHLGSALALFSIFKLIYLRVTTYDEITLIRGGNIAAALSLGGAMLGFCLTLASSLMHNDSLPKFVMWALLAMLVQFVTFFAVTRMVRRGADHIASNNVAMGAYIGLLSLAVGVINAACLS